MEGMESLVRSLRKENAELREDLHTVHVELRRLRSDINRSSATAAGTGAPVFAATETGCGLSERSRQDARAHRRGVTGRANERAATAKRGGVPPPLQNTEEFPSLPAKSSDWMLATSKRGRKREKKALGAANAPRTAEAEQSAPRGLLPSNRAREAPQRDPPRGAVPPPAAPQRNGAKRQPRRRAAPKTAAVTITATGAQPYPEIMREARRMVDIDEIGVRDKLTIRRAMNGGYKLEVSGPEAPALADRLARDLEETIGGMAKIARPTKLAEIRVVGLDESATPDEVAGAICALGKCPRSDLRVGEIRRAANGLGAIWVRLPLKAANSIAKEGRVRVGWASARVHLLRERLLQCYACLQFGHAAAACRSDENRRGRCFRCGGLAHEARGCVNRARCPLCLDAGRNPGHRMGGRACQAVNGPAKKGRGPPNISGGPPGRVGGEVMGTGAPDRHSAARGISAPGASAPGAQGHGPLPERKRAVPRAAKGKKKGGDVFVPPTPLPPRGTTVASPPRRERAPSPVAGPSRLTDPPTQEESQQSVLDIPPTAGPAAAGAATPDPPREEMEWGDWGDV